MPKTEINHHTIKPHHTFHTITPLIAVLIIAAELMILGAINNQHTNTNTAPPNQSTAPDDSHILRGTGTIESCQFPTDQQCGTCYCLRTDADCEIIDGSAVRDLSGLVDTTVTYEASRATGCSGVCQCTIKLLKVTTP
jgi:hypothetical protein